MSDDRKTLMELVEGCGRFSVGGDCDEGRILDGLVRADRLEELGFRRVAVELRGRAERRERLFRIAEFGYVVIGVARIKRYLEMRAERYNNENGNSPGEGGGFRRLFVDTCGNAPLGFIIDTAHGENSGTVVCNNSGGLFQFSGTGLSPFRDDMGNSDDRGNDFACNTCHFYSNDKNTIGRFEWTERRLEDYGAVPPAEVLDVLEAHKRRNVFDYFTIASVNGVVDPLLLGRVNGVEERFFITQWGSDVQLDDLI